MGVVFKQSFKNLVTTYLGFVIGAINVLVLYPNFFNQENYGLVTYLLSAGTLIWPFIGFGIHNTIIKFYSSYTSEAEREKLLSLALIFPLFIGLIIGLIGFLLYGQIQSYFDKNEIIKPYVWLIYVVAITIAYFEVFFAWGKIKLKSVFGNFMREVFHRVGIMVLLFSVYYEWISFETFLYLMVGIYILRTVIIKIYAFWLVPPKLIFQLPTNKKQVFQYTFLILIAGSVATALLDLDKLMIEHYLPIENVSIYGIAAYVATVIVVTSRAMHQITNPITANLLNSKDFSGLEILYKKSSITLLVISGLIFSLIIANISHLYELMPAAYEINVIILILLASVKLYDNLLGNINAILFNSDYYKLVLAVGILVIVLAFVFNIIFIPEYGLLGAAIASFIAFSVYNTAKMFIVYRKFHCHPFNKKTVWVLLLITLISFIFYHIKFSFHPILLIAIKSFFIGIIYLALTYYFKFSEDISAIIEKLLKK